MTKKELSQLYYLNREIKQQQQRLKELENLASSCTVQITGMPKSHDITDNPAKYATEIADLKALLDLNIKRCFYELNRLSRYIESVPDSRMRMILSLRYIKGFSWRKIAFIIGGGNTENGIRKAHDRYLKKI